MRRAATRRWEYVNLYRHVRESKWCMLFAEIERRAERSGKHNGGPYPVTGDDVHTVLEAVCEVESRIRAYDALGVRELTNRSRLDNWYNGMYTTEVSEGQIADIPPLKADDLKSAVIAGMLRRRRECAKLEGFRGAASLSDDEDVEQLEPQRRVVTCSTLVTATSEGIATRSARSTARSRYISSLSVPPSAKLKDHDADEERQDPPTAPPKRGSGRPRKVRAEGEDDIKVRFSKVGRLSKEAKERAMREAALRKTQSQTVGTSSTASARPPSNLVVDIPAKAATTRASTGPRDNRYAPIDIPSSPDDDEQVNETIARAVARKRKRDDKTPDEGDESRESAVTPGVRTHKERVPVGPTDPPRDERTLPESMPAAPERRGPTVAAPAKDATAVAPLAEETAAVEEAHGKDRTQETPAPSSQVVEVPESSPLLANRQPESQGSRDLGLTSSLIMSTDSQLRPDSPSQRRG
jgi:hypothetical protein